MQGTEQRTAATDGLIMYQCRYNRMKNTRHGVMLYNVRDAYIGKSLDIYGEWAWQEIDYTLQFAQSGLVLDIGANIGTHSLVYAQSAAQVVAIEPQIFSHQLLVANLALNAIENVSPLNIAIGADNRQIPITQAHPDQDLNFGGLPVGSGESIISMRTLDSLNFTDVTFMKIDVEGSEEDVLRGGVQTISRYRPVMYIEADRKDRTASLIDFIESLGYVWGWHAPGIYNPGNLLHMPNVFGDLAGINMLCIPKENM